MDTRVPRHWGLHLKAQFVERALEGALILILRKFWRLHYAALDQQRCFAKEVDCTGIFSEGWKNLGVGEAPERHLRPRLWNQTWAGALLRHFPFQEYRWSLVYTGRASAGDRYGQVVARHKERTESSPLPGAENPSHYRYTRVGDGQPKVLGLPGTNLQRFGHQEQIAPGIGELLFGRSNL